MKEPKRKEAKAEMFTTTISLPADVYKQLKHLAVDEEQTVRDLIREAIEELLARKKRGGKR